MKPTKLITVGNVVDLIEAMIEESSLSAHAKSLLGPRTRGSSTDLGLETLNRQIPIVDVTRNICNLIRKPGCMYYMFVADIGGKLGAIELKQAETMGINIEMRTGQHGPELYFDIPAEEAPMVPTDNIYVIIGPTSEYPGVSTDVGVVYTWHPGRPMGVLKDGRNEHTAVKLHNG